MNLKKTFYKLKDNYNLRSYVFASLSFLVNIGFLVFNLIIGVYYHLPFNIAICPYYFLLIILRIIIILFEKRYKEDNAVQNKRIRLIKICSWLLLVADTTIIVPITLMVLQQRNVSLGKIPAIAVAAYTTYKITIAIINLRKVIKNENLSLIGLRMINLLDALVSILTLQNTLVVVFGDETSMFTLMAYTSAGILLLMLAITIIFIKKIKKL